ncbi:hypothetical protein AGIG_G24411 [Arapaima gigas]
MLDGVVKDVDKQLIRSCCSRRFFVPFFAKGRQEIRPSESPKRSRKLFKRPLPQSAKRCCPTPRLDRRSLHGEGCRPPAYSIFSPPDAPAIAQSLPSSFPANPLQQPTSEEHLRFSSAGPKHSCVPLTCQTATELRSSAGTNITCLRMQVNSGDVSAKVCFWNPWDAHRAFTGTPGDPQQEPKPDTERLDYRLCQTCWEAIRHHWDTTVLANVSSSTCHSRWFPAAPQEAPFR